MELITLMVFIIISVAVGFLMGMVVMENTQSESAAETIWKYAGWLTCRAGTLTLGGKHDAAPMAEITESYIKKSYWGRDARAWERKQ